MADDQTRSKRGFASDAEHTAVFITPVYEAGAIGHLLETPEERSGNPAGFAHLKHSVRVS